MPDIFEVFADKATTYLNFRGTRFCLEYKPSALTPAALARARGNLKAEPEQDENVDIITGEDGQEYTVYSPPDGNAGQKVEEDVRSLTILFLLEILIDWDVEIKGEPVPLEYDAMTEIPGVFLDAVAGAIVNDQGQSVRASKRKGASKGHASSFQ